MTLEIETDNNRKIFVSNVYRSPSQINDFTQNEKIDIFMDNFINYQHFLSSKNCQAFLLGDYNINILQKNDNVENFLSSSLAQGFLPVIDKATRLDNYNNSFSCIDNIFKNGDNENCSSGIITSDISDHFTIFHILKNKTKEKT